ncbi:MAG: Gldg family protein [Planctomycetes bacterium]|nr:Gldg family protein [Planctomycetota bacterium]
MGYVFILVFVSLVNAVCFIPKEFYKRNIADLSMLSESMPWILIVLISAISMGSWSQEKEQGTEELLMTLPLTLLQTVLGKFLSIIIFYALALLCSMSCVVILVYLGEPDLGLITCNYIGWFLMGAAFAALSLCASVLSGNQAVSFVLASIFCSLAYYVGQLVHWGDALQRGILSFSDVAIALAMICSGLGVALFILSSRRWQAEDRSSMGWSIIALLAAIGLSLNCARIADRWNMNVDLSVAGLSSLSSAAQDILEQCQTPVRITAVISADVPADYALRAQELQDMLHAIEAYAGAKVQVDLVRPIDPLTATGIYVQEQYGVTARPVVSETLAGKRSVELFLGFHVRSDTHSQHVAFIESGMSIEYEILRAVRGIDLRYRKQKKCIGIVSTEIEMIEYPSRFTGALEPSWLFVQDLESFYDIRAVSAEEPIDDSIDVLIVPLPSGLTARQMLQVHDYMWSGRPTLLMSDPWPGLMAEKLDDYGIAIAPTLPRYDRFEEGGEYTKKGDIATLYKALGIRLDLDNVYWSQLKPDAGLANLPDEMIWLNDASGSFAENPILHGMQSMMCIYPGAIYTLPQSEMQVASLIRLSDQAAYGSIAFSEYLKPNAESYQFVAKHPRSLYQAASGEQPDLAVKVRGRMRRTLVDEDADDTKKIGEQSAVEVQVVVLADIDMAHDYFFTMDNYLKQDNSKEDQHIWASLRNVQFLSNVVDWLAGDSHFANLRQRVQRYRSLVTLDDVLADSIRRKEENHAAAQELIHQKVQKLMKDVQLKIQAVHQREDLDLSAKTNKSEMLKLEGANYLKRIKEMEEKSLAIDLRKINMQETRTIGEFLTEIKCMAIAIPAMILSLVIVFVFILRLRREQRYVPESRLRKKS